MGNLLLDQKEIWTSPFHMHKKNAKWWIGFGAVTAALVATDHRTSTVFENSKGQVAWGNNISTIGASYTLIPLVAGFYGYGVLRSDAKSREVGVLGTEALLDSLIVVEVLKPIAGRQRPDSKGEKGQFFDGGDSFPSGHAIESWALASVIAHEYRRTKWVPVVAYGLAWRCQRRLSANADPVTAEDPLLLLGEYFSGRVVAARKSPRALAITVDRLEKCHRISRAALRPAAPGIPPPG